MKDTDIDLAYADLRESDMVATDKVGNGYLEFNTLTGTLKKTVPLFKTLNTLALKTDNNLNTFLMKDTATFLGSIDANQDWNNLPTTSGWYQVNNFSTGKNAPVGATTYGFLLYLVGNSANTQTQIYFPRVAPANSASIPRVRSTWGTPVKWSAWSLLTQGYTKEEIDAKVKVVTDKANEHIGNRNNPHGVNAEQVGTYTKAVVEAKLKMVSDSKQDKLVEYSRSGADGFSGWHGAVYFHRIGRVCNVHIDIAGGGIGQGTKMVSIPDWAIPDTKFNVAPHFVVMSGGYKAGTCYVSVTGKAIYVESISQGGRAVGNVTYLTN